VKRYLLTSGLALGFACCVAPLGSTPGADADDHATQCFKHEGGDLTNAHGSTLTDQNGVTYVKLNQFDQSWFGDHWESIQVKGGPNAGPVIPHPSAGTAYYALLNPNSGKPYDVSWWKVCKGETPDEPTTTTTTEPSTTTTTEAAPSTTSTPTSSSSVPPTVPETSTSPAPTTTTTPPSSTTTSVSAPPASSSTVPASPTPSSPTVPETPQPVVAIADPPTVSPAPELGTELPQTGLRPSGWAAALLGLGCVLAGLGLVRSARRVEDPS
jgi:hypothetical protein